MYSFQAKIGLKKMRKGENKNYRSVPTRHVFENSKEIAKRFKNTIMASFQKKIGWKIAKKFKNLKNTVMYSFQAKIGL